VQDRARRIVPFLQRDLTIELAPGEYRVRTPLVLKPDDSGHDGHIIRWHGPDSGQAILDGGVRIRGWVQVDSARHLWRAALPADAYSLQLFVNGTRAVRARHSGCGSPEECRYTVSGLAGAAGKLPYLSHPEDVVAVFGVRWRDFHCGVERVDGDDIVMRPSCWRNTIVDSVKNHWSEASPKGKPFKGIDWFENAYEFLGTPGQFYIDPRKHVVYYVSRLSEDMKTVDVEMPVTEHLLLAEGSPREHVHDVEFHNISFQHAAWVFQEYSDGYVPLQAGYLVNGVRNDLPHNGEGLWRIPAAVEVSGGERIRFVSDHFSALGAAGVTLAAGTRDSAIQQCTFDDLSGGAIFVGDTVAAPVDPRERSGGVIVSRNTITNIAKEYRDNVAIMGGFNDALTIDHNTIREVPYTGISVGWGWNYEGPGDVQRDIQIRSNRISRFMLVLHDGGAIYTQAQSPGSDVIENYIDFKGSDNGNGIYLDERSRYYSVCGNVVWDMPKKMQEGQWVSAWSSWSGNLKIHGNWSNDPHTTLHNQGPTKEFYDNHLALEALPPEAQSVIEASGADGKEGLVTKCAQPLNENN
jgi:beta-glucuronidase